MSNRNTRASGKPSQATLTSSTSNPTNPIRSGTNLSNKRSPKLGREVFTSRAPLAPRQDIRKEQLASDELLLQLGFALSDDNTWYHPQTTFKCAKYPSRRRSSCKWRRDTIFRCLAPIPTIEEPESLYHPLCVNADCRWNPTSPHMMRLKPEGLVTLKFEDPEWHTFSKKFKGKSSARSEALPNTKPIEPSLEVPTKEPVTKRTISNLPSNVSTSIATPKRARQQADPSPHLPSASSTQARGEKRKEPPPADSPPPQMPKTFRIDMTERQDFQAWKASRALSTDDKSNKEPELSTYEQLDKANRKIAELEGIIEGLKSESRKRRR